MSCVDTANKHYQLTHPQKRIWYIEKIYGPTALYNIGGTIRVKGMVDFERLKKSINVFIKKNEALRLRIVEEDGEVKQFLRRHQEENIDFIDFSIYKNPEEQLYKWVQEESGKVFDFEGDLFYFAVFKLDTKNSGYFVRFHHIISDGWSINIMTEQICDTYLKLSRGENADEEVRYSYLDYIGQEQKYLHSERYLKDKQFWNEKFRDFPGTSLNKGSDSLKGNRKTFHLSGRLPEKIKGFVAEKKVSLNTFYITLLLLYLHLTTQEKDMVIGIPVLNRSGKKERNIFGMFTSTMPFRMAVKQDEKAIEFMKEIERALMGCFRKQKYPYDLLVQDLQMKKKGMDSLFQICVNYYNTKLNNELDGMALYNEEFYNGNQLYSLQLVIKDWNEAKNLILDFDYKVEDFSEQEIDLLFERLNRLAEQVLNEPDRQVGNLQLLSESEIHRLLFEFNQTEARYPQNETVVQLFEEQVRLHPEKVAVYFETREVTYGELNEKSNQLARYLRDSGIGPERVVGILTAHSIETIIAIMSVLKAGGAYVPIDPAYPADRIEFMLNDAKAQMVLTNCILDEGIRKHFGGQVLDLEDPTFYKGDKHNLESINQPSDLVYIIYTSGSTGKPKGVMIEHQGLMNYLWWGKKVYVRETNQVFPLYSSLSFDLTVTSVFLPLITGNQMIVYRDDGEEFVLYRIMKENRATVIKLTPSHLSLLKDMDNGKSSVQRFIVGGEDLKVNLADKIYKSFAGNIEIFNEYGPTETVVGCMIYQYDPEKDKGVSVPIGKPSDNVQIYLLNQQLKPLPPGGSGEIYISGDGVARGYIHRTDLTKERFLANPFLAGKRIYKTGDLARLNQNGDLEYLGRIDHQVKIRGFRIELSEIISCLLEYDDIRDATVIDREDDRGNKFLCAYIVASKKLTEDEIRKHLEQSLPGYMIPSQLAFIDQLPLTSNGKVDRKRLPKPVESYCLKEYIPARNETEVVLISKVQEILGTERVSIMDNFYHLGGDSIKAIQIASKLNNEGLVIKVKDILSHPVLGEMSEFIRNKSKHEHVEQILCEGSVGRIPITEWFFEQRFEEENHWNQSVFLVLEKEVEIQKIRSALNEILKHHDALRLNYNIDQGVLYYNKEHLQQDVDFPLLDLSLYSLEEQEKRMEQIGGQIKSSMDIAKGMLFKACLFDLGEKRGKRLLLTAHHLVVDGVSWRIILEDLALLLEADQQQPLPSLPPKTHSLQQWAKAFKKYGREEVLKEKEYWCSILKRNVSFPTDYDEGQDHEGSKETLFRELTLKETKWLMYEANQAFGTKPEEILLISLALVMHQWSGQSDVVFEVESHGRTDLLSHMDVSRTVGWFTSIYPVLLEVGSSELSHQIKSLKEQLRRVPNKGIGYSVLKYLSNELEDVPLKFVRFNYLGDFDNSFKNNVFKFSNESSGSDFSGKNHLACLIEINAMVVESKLGIRIAFSKNRYKEESMENFGDRLIEQIRNLLAYCVDKDGVEFTSSDFDTVDIAQDELDNLFA